MPKISSNIQQLFRILWRILLLLLLTTTTFASNVDQSSNLWGNLDSTGDIANSNFLSLIEFHARLRDTNNALEQAIVRIALGYTCNSVVSLWLGFDFLRDNDTKLNDVITEQRIWQQALLHLVLNDKLHSTTRIRIEQRFNETGSGTAYRFRQKVTFEFPNRWHYKITPVISDEIFLNLNHPVWINDNLLDQNRFFVGIDFPCKKIGTWRIGYLNQYALRDPTNKLDHVVSISLTIHHDLFG